MTSRMTARRLSTCALMLAAGCMGGAPLTERALAAKPPDTQPATQVNVMKLRITIAGSPPITVTLDDNATARDFASLLPLRLELRDYAATEKISDLPRRLSTKGAPAGHEPVAGDLTYYAPWGNLALFHKNFRYSSGLIRLGRLDAGVQALKRAGPLRATIERLDE